MRLHDSEITYSLMSKCLHNRVNRETVGHKSLQLNVHTRCRVKEKEIESKSEE